VATDYFVRLTTPNDNTLAKIIGQRFPAGGTSGKEDILHKLNVILFFGLSKRVLDPSRSDKVGGLFWCGTTCGQAKSSGGEHWSEHTKAGSNIMCFVNHFLHFVLQF